MQKPWRQDANVNHMDTLVHKSADSKCSLVWTTILISAYVNRQGPFRVAEV